MTNHDMTAAANVHAANLNSPVQILRRAVLDLNTYFTRRRENRKARIALGNLDDRLLRDIGLSRADLHRLG